MPPQCVIRRVPAAIVALIIMTTCCICVSCCSLPRVLRMLFWWLFVYVPIRICFILWSGPGLTNCDYDFAFGSVWSLGHRWGGLAPMVRQFKEVARFGMLQMSPGGQRTIQPQWGRQAEMMPCKDDIRSGHVFHSVSLSICFPCWLLPCQHRGIQQYSASFHLRTAKLFLLFTCFFKQFSFGCLWSVPWFWRLFLGVFPHDSRAKWENRQAVLRHSSTGKSGFDQWYSEVFSLMLF